MAVLTMTLTGCVSIGTSGPHSVPIEAASLDLKSTSGTSESNTWPTLHWWDEFNDPQLDRLISAALADSPSLKLAEARIRRAQQTAAFVAAAQGPGIALNAETTRERLPENYIFPPPLGGSTQSDSRVALDFAYEFDFWGKHRAAINSAAKQAQALAAEAESAKLVLSLAVTRTYVQLQRRYEELAIAQDTLKQRKAISGVVAARIRSGLDNRSEMDLPSARISSSNLDIAGVEENITLLKHQLAALTGQGPSAAEKITPPRLSGNPALAAPRDLPIDLLGRRPDIVAQRLRIEASSEAITATKAEFYPNVNLTAFFGFQSIGLDRLFDMSSRTIGAGPAFHLPIFKAGQLRADVATKYAEYDIAVEQYNQTVIDSVREVADQGATLRAIARQRQASAETLTSLQRAYDVALVRYRSGLTSQLTLLNTESDLLAQRRIDIELHERERQAVLTLIRALGGGYVEVPQGTNQQRTNG